MCTILLRMGVDTSPKSSWFGFTATERACIALHPTHQPLWLLLQYLAFWELLCHCRLKICCPSRSLQWAGIAGIVIILRSPQPTWRTPPIFSWALASRLQVTRLWIQMMGKLAVSPRILQPYSAKLFCNQIKVDVRTWFKERWNGCWSSKIPKRN